MGRLRLPVGATLLQPRQSMAAQKMNTAQREAEYKRLRTLADQAKAEHDRAQGALEQAVAALRDEFGVDTLEGAEELLVGLQAEAAKADKAFSRAMAKFAKEWDDEEA